MWKSNDGHLQVYDDSLKGKVVIMAEIPETSGSKEYSIKWDKKRLRILDDFWMQRMSYDTKFNNIKWNIKNEEMNEKLKFHFISGTSITHQPKIIAREMNKRMYTYLKYKRDKKLPLMGVIVMDYPGMGLIQEVIDRNKFEIEVDSKPLGFVATACKYVESVKDSFSKYFLRSKI